MTAAMWRLWRTSRRYWSTPTGSHVSLVAPAVAGVQGAVVVALQQEGEEMSESWTPYSTQLIGSPWAPLSPQLCTNAIRNQACNACRTESWFIVDLMMGKQVAVGQYRVRLFSVVVVSMLLQGASNQDLLYFAGGGGSLEGEGETVFVNVQEALVLHGIIFVRINQWANGVHCLEGTVLALWRCYDRCTEGARGLTLCH